MFCKKGVLRNFAKFTGKHLCQSLFFNKVAGLGSEYHGIIKKFPYPVHVWEYSCVFYVTNNTVLSNETRSRASFTFVELFVTTILSKLFL